MILLILTVLCQGPVPVTELRAETTQTDYEHDLQLVRIGWYDAETNLRCKAIRVKYRKGGTDVE